MNKGNLVIERDREEDLKSIKKTDHYIYVILFFLVSIVPIIVQAHVIDYISPIISDYSFLRSGVKVDLFSSYKFITISIGASLLFVLFFYKVMLLDSKFNIYKPINILIYLSILFILVLSLFNDYGYLSLYGNFERHEGMLTYIAYLIILLITVNMQFTRQQINKLVFALYPLTLINFILSSLDFLGIDVESSSIFNGLITMIESPDQELTIQSTDIVFTTLYNQNYLSGLSAALTLIFAVAAINSSKKFVRISHIVSSLLSFSMLFTSLSTSGLLTFIIGGALIAIYYLKEILRNKKILITLVTFVLVCFTTILILMNTNEKVKQEFSNVSNEITSFFQVNEVDEQALTEGLLPEMPQPGVAGGSGRAYIWSETLELIKDRPLVGYGFDTLAYEFDQNQLSKVANLESHTVVVDKPHNWYLFLAYSGGIPLLISILAVIALIVIPSIKRLFVNREGNVLVPLIGVLAILIQWLVNDSVIGVGIIFWVLLGLLGSMLINTENVAEDQPL